jgi:hypothetical protein
MPERVYFDTNVFREVGGAFEKNSLPDDLREKVLVSPLTTFEVLSQLTVKNADEVLRQIKAIHNWTNPKSTGLLPWPDDALAQFWFEKPTADDGYAEKMQKAFNVCLAAHSVESLREDAGKLKDAMDAMKRRTAEDFGRLLEHARKEPLVGDKFSEAWFLGIANRIHADPKSKSVSEIVHKLSAYHEFEQVKLAIALHYPKYKPENHMNDLLDAEQLVYLGAPALCFLTGDRGFERVTKSEQAARIFVVAMADVSDARKLEALLREIVE